MNTVIEPTNGQGEIAARAYKNWLQRRDQGDIQDWLNAEADIRRLHDPTTHLNLELAAKGESETAVGRQLAESQRRIAGLLAERTQAQQRLNAEHNVNRTLAGSTEFIEAAPPILQAICESLAWDVGAVWLVDQDTAALRCAGVWHARMTEIAEFEKNCRRTTFPVGVGFPGRIWASGSVAWIPDVTVDTNFPRASVAAHDGLHGAVGFPLWNGIQFLGVMEFFSRQVVQPDADVIEMMQCIGRQISQFIERRKAHNGRLLWQEECRIARGIQQRLLPKFMPTLDRFTIGGMSVPASAVGGDCFDFIPLSVDGGDDLGVVLADASGHGIGAALVVAETHAYLRALTLACTDLSKLLVVTNRRLMDNRDTSVFVTLLLVQLDPRNRSLIYSGAGHCPGYVLDGHGLIRAILASEGLPLGVESKSEFPTSAPVQLQTDDLIFLYTDGIVEAGFQNGSPFGLERALDIIRTHQRETPHDILQELFKAVTAFSPGQLYDDLTAVIIKVEDAARAAHC